MLYIIVNNINIIISIAIYYVIVSPELLFNLVESSLYQPARDSACIRSKNLTEMRLAKFSARAAHSRFKAAGLTSLHRHSERKKQPLHLARFSTLREGSAGRRREPALFCASLRCVAMQENARV